MKFKWKKLFLILLALIAVSSLLVGVLWTTNALGWRAWRLQEVQTFIAASLPEGAADVHFATQNSQTRIVWLRFELPPNADLSTFLSAMSVQAPLQPGFSPFPAANPQEAALTWWTPQAASDYAGVYQNTGQKVIEILMAGQTVYVRAYRLSA